MSRNVAAEPAMTASAPSDPPKPMPGWFRRAIHKVLGWFCRAIYEVIPMTSKAQLALFGQRVDEYEDPIKIIQVGDPSEDDPMLLELSLKLFDNAASRGASIESRAGVMMSAISLAAALITGVGFTTLKDTSALTSSAFLAIFVTLVVALTYLTRTAVLLFKIQGPVRRTTPDPRDLVPPASAKTSAYPRAVAVSVLRYTTYNYKANFTVVTQLWSAQKCFRNALFTVVIGGLVATGLQWWLNPVAASGPRLAQALARSAGCTDLPSLTMGPTGVWRGACLRSGKSANVHVDADGTVGFEP